VTLVTTHDPNHRNPDPIRRMRRSDMLHLLYDNGWILGRNERRYLWRCPCGGRHDIESIRTTEDQRMALRMIDLCRESLAQEVNR
jgi:hypothetical protein